MIYLLSIKIQSDPDVYELRGIYDSETDARNTTLDGDFLINKYQPGFALNESIIDAGQTGAVLFSKVSSDSTVQDLSDRLAEVESYINELKIGRVTM